jgi:hypothetical protein
VASKIEIDHHVALKGLGWISVGYDDRCSYIVWVNSIKLPGVIVEQAAETISTFNLSQSGAPARFEESNVGKPCPNRNSSGYGGHWHRHDHQDCGRRLRRSPAVIGLALQYQAGARL